MKKPNQIPAEFAAHAVETPIISPVLAIYWGKLTYIQTWPIKVQPITRYILKLQNLKFFSLC